MNIDCNSLALTLTSRWRSVLDLELLQLDRFFTKTEFSNVKAKLDTYFGCGYHYTRRLL